MRVVVSGGGTAGHISPTLATCDALKSLDSTVELLYVGQADGMEAKIVAARGLRFAAIKAGKFRRLHSASALGKLLNPQTLGPNARDLGRVVAGVAGALKILRQFKPDVVFIKGGFVGLPVGIAAKLLGLPFVIHESDVTPGLANRILARWATRIAVGFPAKHYREFDPERVVFTGNPVRKELLGLTRADGIGKLELNADLPVVFVTGGSGGAAQINDAVIRALPQLLAFSQVVHLTGEGEYERVKFEVRRAGQVAHIERYHPYGFLMGEMAAALASADVVVTRAGANTIAELAVLGKPTIVIPNSGMAGHQVENARMLSRVGAVRVLDGERLTSAQLVGEVKRVLEDDDERARLVAGIRRFGRLEAPSELAQLILAVGRAGESSVQKPNTEPNE